MGFANALYILSGYKYLSDLNYHNFYIMSSIHMSRICLGFSDGTCKLAIPAWLMLQLQCLLKTDRLCRIENVQVLHFVGYMGWGGGGGGGGRREVMF